MFVVLGILKHLSESILSNISNFNESVHKLNLVISEFKTDVHVALNFHTVCRGGI